MLDTVKLNTLKNTIGSFVSICGIGLSGGTVALQATGADISQSVFADTLIAEISLAESSTKDDLQAMAAVTKSVMVTFNAGASEEPAVEDPQAGIANFLPARARHVITAQPDLTGLLTGTNSDALHTTTGPDGSAFDIPATGNQPPWGRLQGGWSTSNGQDNSYFFGAIGRHFNPTPNSIAGLMLQIDGLTQEGGEAIPSGSGYLVGPYFAAKVPYLWGAAKHSVSIEGGYLLGRTVNTSRIDGAPDQGFDTGQALFEVKVSGQWVYYGDLLVTPSLSVSRFIDTLEAFVDNSGNTIDEHGIVMAEGAIGLDFLKPLPAQNGEVLLTGGVAGVWSVTDNDGFARTTITDDRGHYSGLRLGAIYTTETGVIINGAGSYDGLLTDDYQNFGFELGLNLAF